MRKFDLNIEKILENWDTSHAIREIIAKDLIDINLGTAHDELTWIDVQEHSVKILNQQGKHLFGSNATS